MLRYADCSFIILEIDGALEFCNSLIEDCWSVFFCRRFGIAAAWSRLLKIFASNTIFLQPVNSVRDPVTSQITCQIVWPGRKVVRLYLVFGGFFPFLANITSINPFYHITFLSSRARKHIADHVGTLLHCILKLSFFLKKRGKLWEIW